MNDIYETSIQQFINRMNQEESIIEEAIDVLSDSIEQKEEELQKLKDFLDDEDWKLTRKRIAKSLLKHHTKKLSNTTLEGLPVSLDGGVTWYTVTSVEADEHGNITISDGDSTRSVAIKDVTPAPIAIDKTDELHQAPVGTTVFLGRETFKKMDDTTWLKHRRTTSYMDEDEWEGDDNVETSKVSTQDMEEELRKKYILMAKTWGDIPLNSQSAG